MSICPTGSTNTGCFGGWEGEGAARRRDGDFAEIGSEVLAWHKGNIPGAALSDRDGAKRVQTVDITASGMAGPPVKGSAEGVLQSSPPPSHLFPEEGDVGLCPALHWPSWEFPACAHGDAEHCSHIGCGTKVPRKVLSSFIVVFYPSQSCPTLPWLCVKAMGAASLPAVLPGEVQDGHTPRGRDAPAVPIPCGHVGTTHTARTSISPASTSPLATSLTPLSPSCPLGFKCKCCRAPSSGPSPVCADAV